MQGQWQPSWKAPHQYLQTQFLGPRPWTYSCTFTFGCCSNLSSWMLQPFWNSWSYLWKWGGEEWNQTKAFPPTALPSCAKVCTPALPDLFVNFYSEQPHFNNPDLARAERSMCSLLRCSVRLLCTEGDMERREKVRRWNFFFSKWYKTRCCQTYFKEYAAELC